MAFIGDDHLLLSEGLVRNPDAFEIPGLVLLDTSVSAVSSAIPSDVRFVCDPRYRGLRVRVVAEDAGWSDPSGAIGRDALSTRTLPGGSSLWCFYWGRVSHSRLRVTA